MKYLIPILLFSFSAYSQINRFPDDLFFISQDCRNVATDMVTGELKIHDGDEVSIGCIRGDDLQIACSYYDSNQKLISTINANGGISGTVGSIQGDGDFITLNSETKIFSSHANINLFEGRFIGKKICSGVWIFKKELEEKKAKKSVPKT